MKKLRAEIRIMKAAFLAIACLMIIIFGFMIAVTEVIGATVMTVILMCLILAAAFLSLAASGVLPIRDGEEDDDNE